jgi:ABC-type branched-subunit amino acid transport system substrate-binding protein
MTRTQQVELLVRYAITTLKRQHFGIIYPNDKYGSGFADAFKAEVENQGATVVGTQAYQPSTTTSADAVAAVKRWETKNLDAVFIPDAAPIATAIAADVRDQMPLVVLLGTESWNDATTLAAAGPSINGAVFADAFFAESPRPSTREFVERFQRGAGRLPTVFEAQAFDAGMAVRHVFAGGATSRPQVIAQLMALGSFEGAGELRSSPGGLQRALSLLRYFDGKVEEVPVAATGS